MERKSVTVKDLKVGSRYRKLIDKKIPCSYSFVVSKINEYGVYIIYTDDLKPGLYYASDESLFVEFPFTSLEKELL